jgi:predicted HAD superfamily phosphohydrolase
MILLMRLAPLWMLRRLERCVGITSGSSQTAAERLETIGSTLDMKYAEVCKRLAKFVKPFDPNGSYTERIHRLCASKVGLGELNEMHELLYQCDDEDLPAGHRDYELEEHADLIEDVDLLEKSLFQLDYLRGMLVPSEVHDAWPVP